MFKKEEWKKRVDSLRYDHTMRRPCLCVFMELWSSHLQVITFITHHGSRERDESRLRIVKERLSGFFFLIFYIQKAGYDSFPYDSLILWSDISLMNSHSGSTGTGIEDTFTFGIGQEKEKISEDGQCQCK